MRKSATNTRVIKIYSRQDKSITKSKIYAVKKGDSFYIVKKYSNPVFYSMGIFSQLKSLELEDAIEYANEVVESIPEEEQKEIFEAIEEAAERIESMSFSNDTLLSRKTRNVVKKSFSYQSAEEVQKELNKKLDDLKRKYSRLMAKIQREWDSDFVTIKNAVYRSLKSNSYVKQNYSEEDISFLANAIAYNVKMSLKNGDQISKQEYRKIISELDEKVKSIKEFETSEKFTLKGFLKKSLKYILAVAAFIALVVKGIPKIIEKYAVSQIEFQDMMEILTNYVGPGAAIFLGGATLALLAGGVAYHFISKDKSEKSKDYIESIVMQSLQDSELQSLLKSISEVQSLHDKRVAVSTMLVQEGLGQ